MLEQFAKERDRTIGEQIAFRAARQNRYELRLMPEADEGSIAKEILSHLLAHANVEDTIEGIVEWWLLEEKIRYRSKKVQETLDRLVADNLILARRSRDSRIRYRINNQRVNEIRALLSEDENRD